MDDCYDVTAHYLEMPGEIFSIAMEKKSRIDQGVVGSTADILNFHLPKSERGCCHRVARLLAVQFLGTEAGMVKHQLSRQFRIFWSRPILSS